MSSNSKQSMMALLEGQRALLDEVIGSGAYEIEASCADQAKLKIKLLEATFAWERNGVIDTRVMLRSPPANTSGNAGTWLWAKFLNVVHPSGCRLPNGRELSAPEEQVRAEIELIGRLIADVFADTQRLRDAAFYVDGYTLAYNDWASGNW